MTDEYDRALEALSVFDSGYKGEHIEEWCQGPEIMQAQSGVFGFEFNASEIETIRTALQRAGKVEGLVKALGEISKHSELNEHDLVFEASRSAKIAIEALAAWSNK